MQDLNVAPPVFPVGATSFSLAHADREFGGVVMMR